MTNWRLLDSIQPRVAEFVAANGGCVIGRAAVSRCDYSSLKASAPCSEGPSLPEFVNDQAPDFLFVGGGETMPPFHPGQEVQFSALCDCARGYVCT